MGKHKVGERVLSFSFLFLSVFSQAAPLGKNRCKLALFQVTFKIESWCLVHKWFSTRFLLKRVWFLQTLPSSMAPSNSPQQPDANSSISVKRETWSLVYERSLNTHSFEPQATRFNVVPAVALSTASFFGVQRWTQTYPVSVDKPPRFTESSVTGEYTVSQLKRVDFSADRKCSSEGLALSSPLPLDDLPFTSASISRFCKSKWTRNVKTSTRKRSTFPVWVDLNSVCSMLVATGVWQQSPKCKHRKFRNQRGFKFGASTSVQWSRKAGSNDRPRTCHHSLTSLHRDRGDR